MKTELLEEKNKTDHEESHLVFIELVGLILITSACRVMGGDGSADLMDQARDDSMQQLDPALLDAQWTYTNTNPDWCGVGRGVYRSGFWREKF